MESCFIRQSFCESDGDPTDGNRDSSLTPVAQAPSLLWEAELVRLSQHRPDRQSREMSRTARECCSLCVLPELLSRADASAMQVSIPFLSQYAAEALALHGASRGAWLAMRVVSRCNTFYARRCGPRVPMPRLPGSTVHGNSGTQVRY